MRDHLSWEELRIVQKKKTQAKMSSSSNWPPVRCTSLAVMRASRQPREMRVEEKRFIHAGEYTIFRSTSGDLEEGATKVEPQLSVVCPPCRTGKEIPGYSRMPWSDVALSYPLFCGGGG